MIWVWLSLACVIVPWVAAFVIARLLGGRHAPRQREDDTMAVADATREERLASTGELAAVPDELAARRRRGQR